MPYAQWRNYVFSILFTKKLLLILFINMHGGEIIFNFVHKEIAFNFVHKFVNMRKF